MASQSATYDASAIETLEGLEAVRARPGMYVGGTGTAGLLHLVWEILDNAIDEAAAGHANKVTVTLHEDGSVTVTDNGRGIPVDRHPKHKVSALEVVFTQLHAGGKFGGGAYDTSGGLHGVGASIVNALSSRVDVAVCRSSKRHTLSFQEREPGYFTPSGRFKPSHELQTSRCPKSQTGTEVRFWPDTMIFADAEEPITITPILQRVNQACYLVPALSVSVTDEASGKTVTIRKQKGLTDYVNDLCGEQSAVTPIISLSGSGEFEETVPVNNELQTVERHCDVRIVMRWVNSFDTKVSSFVNTIPTYEGGTHLLGFEASLARIINSKLLDGSRKLARLSKQGDNKATKEDVYEGLVAAVRVTLPEPQFEGQTKAKLGTPAVRSIVSSVLSDGLEDWFKAHSRPATALANKIADAVLGRVAARDKLSASRKARQTQRSDLPPKLADCRKHGPDSELLLVEGDSAAGPAKRGRDSSFMAVLPLRGKIVNAAKASTKQVLDNAEANAIITSIGAGAGNTFDLEAARYGRIVILCDADVDGSHIRCLLLTLLYKHMKPMLEAGRVFTALPPLYTAKVGDKTYRVHSDEERDEMTKKLTTGRRKASSIKWQRFKGLGEMNTDELRHCALDPETRALRRLTIADAREAEAAAAMIETLMGSDVKGRRDWIIDQSSLSDLDALDV